MNSPDVMHTGQASPGQKGKLIVIEGIDGSGKTVQTQMLVKRLLEEGLQVQMTDFPQYGKSFFGNMIERYLKGEFGWPQELKDHLKKYPIRSGTTHTSNLASSEASGKDLCSEVGESTPDEVNPYLSSLLYAGDRWEMKDRMNKWLEEGNIIISNRYVCSNMAHQGAKINDDGERDEFFKWLDELEHKKYTIPEPDLIIYLHVPIEVSQELIKINAQKEQGFKSKIDMHEKDVGYLRRVQNVYTNLARENNKWSMIDCLENSEISSKEKISEKVWDIVIKVVK